jgi:hypothetical protein
MVKPEMSGAVANAIKGALGLFGDTNKAEGVNEESKPVPVDEYESTLSEDKIIGLVSNWKKTYNLYYEPISKTQESAYNYWIGLQRASDINESDNGETDKLVDNLIFEALETFLPIATRANPDPLVKTDPTDIDNKFARSIKEALVHEADVQKLRRKLAKCARHWAIYRVGVLKVTWDVRTKSIKTDVINARRMIFDKDGYIDEGGHFIGEYLGEKKKDTAERLIELFPNKKQEISRKVEGKLGTKVEYYEWWYLGSDVFFTMDDIVLGKFKNPNWNYDGTIKEKDPETGAEIETDIQGVNHLKEKCAPYVFLSVFSMGLHPHDDTSLIIQNLPLQDKINRRERQIDKNVQSQNNGLVVSGKSFTEEQASQAASALRRGVAIRVPDGNVTGAVQRFPAQGLPADIFRDLDETKDQLRNLFGTAGSTAEGLESQKSVRGKIMISQQDSSRIGGGITEQLEQVADTIYNLWVQFMFVYYDEEHFITSAGLTEGTELFTLKKENFPLLKTLDITVKEGSLIPKDPLTQRNEAIDLWSAGVIDPLSFYKRLDVPDPIQMTQQLILWQMLQKGQVPPQMRSESFQVNQSPMGGLPQPAGVGGPAVNPIGQPAQPINPVPTSPEAVQAQSAQTLRSVPLQ